MLARNQKFFPHDNNFVRNDTCWTIAFFSGKEVDGESEESSESVSSGVSKGRRSSTRAIQRHEVRQLKKEESDEDESEITIGRVLNLADDCKLPSRQVFQPAWDGTSLLHLFYFLFDWSFHYIIVIF